MNCRNATLRNAALQRDQWKCCNCNSPAEHAHHVVPLVYGGRDVVGNLVSLCSTCHGAVHGLDMAHHKTLSAVGMAKAKARGVKLGGLRPGTMKANRARKERALVAVEKLRPVLAPMASTNMSLRAMAEALAAAGITTRNGLAVSPSTVKLQLQRLGLR
jgi:hypothetical protein